jgi:hypothetical protein
MMIVMLMWIVLIVIVPQTMHVKNHVSPSARQQYATRVSNPVTMDLMMIVMVRQIVMILLIVLLILLASIVMLGAHLQFVSPATRFALTVLMMIVTALLIAMT